MPPDEEEPNEQQPPETTDDGGLSDEELAEWFDPDAAPPAQQTPTPEPEAVPSPQGDQGAPPAPGQEGAPPPAVPTPDLVPSWLDHIPAEERRAVIEQFLDSLPPEEVAKLPKVNDIVNRTAQSASQRARTAIQSETAEQERARQQAAAANSLIKDLQQAISQGDTTFDLDNRLQGYADVRAASAAAERQQGLEQDISQALVNAAAHFGLERFPDEVIAAVQRLPEAEVGRKFGLFVGYLANHVKESAAPEWEKANGAKYAVDRARIIAEHEAELAKQGRLRDRVPPELEGRPGVSGRQYSAEEITNMSDEEYDRHENEILAGAGLPV